MLSFSDVFILNFFFYTRTKTVISNTDDDDRSTLQKKNLLKFKKNHVVSFLWLTYPYFMKMILLAYTVAYDARLNV